MGFDIEISKSLKYEKDIKNGEKNGGGGGGGGSKTKIKIIIQISHLSRAIFFKF